MASVRRSASSFDHLQTGDHLLTGATAGLVATSALGTAEVRTIRATVSCNSTLVRVDVGDEPYRLTDFQVEFTKKVNKRSTKGAMHHRPPPV